MRHRIPQRHPRLTRSRVLAGVTALLTVVTRAQHDIEAIEEYVARELGVVGFYSSVPEVGGSVS